MTLTVLVPNLCFGLKCYQCSKAGGRAVDAMNITCKGEEAEIEECSDTVKSLCFTRETQINGKFEGVGGRGCMEEDRAKGQLQQFGGTYSGAKCYDVKPQGKPTKMCFCDTDKCNTVLPLPGGTGGTGGKSDVGVLYGSWIIIVTSSLTLIFMLQ